MLTRIRDTAVFAYVASRLATTDSRRWTRTVRGKTDPMLAGSGYVTLECHCSGTELNIEKKHILILNLGNLVIRL